MVSSDSRMATFFRSYQRYQNEQGKEEILEIPKFDDVLPDNKQNEEEEVPNVEEDNQSEPDVNKDLEQKEKVDEPTDDNQPDEQKEEEKVIEVQ
jgi:hypothetical protein